jgi:EAL domain-containing protein (putative c-di-GMP-specific phosphodiesterase class I)
LEIIAEGVETKEQLAFINELTCERAQGYHFSRPISSHELMELQLGLRAG